MNINNMKIAEMMNNHVIKLALKMLKGKQKVLRNKEPKIKIANTKIKRLKLYKISITKKIFKDLSRYKMKNIKIKKALKNLRVIKIFNIQMMKFKIKKAHRTNLIY